MRAVGADGHSVSRLTTAKGTPRHFIFTLTKSYVTAKSALDVVVFQVIAFSNKGRNKKERKIKFDGKEVFTILLSSRGKSANCTAQKRRIKIFKSSEFQLFGNNFLEKVHLSY